MLGVTNTPPLRRTIDPKTGDGILYCDRCGHQEHRYKLHAITLAVELKEPGQWVGQFRITLLGKQATTICTAYASGTFDNPEGDRKSTRLNSSHLVISYAVFCLKKK